MAIDYTTYNNVISWGQADASFSEQALVQAFITATSRALDTYCHQAFSQQTVTAQTLPAKIDRDGCLVCHPPTPLITTLTAVSWRFGTPDQPWNSISAGQWDYYSTSSWSSGASDTIVRTFPIFSSYRGSPYRFQMQLSYTGGWDGVRGNGSPLYPVPDDFEMGVRRAVWWAYKKRDTTGERTANPALGMVVIPSAWPPDLRQTFKPYVRWVG